MDGRDQALGGIAAVFTLGTAQAPTQAGQAARIAATVATIIDALRDFALAVHAAAAAVAPIADVAADVRAAVAWLRELRIVQAEVDAVPGLRVYQIVRVEGCDRKGDHGQRDEREGGVSGAPHRGN